MKKNSIVIAMVLVLALTVSAFAGSFADVPANHWAYEAVNKLVAAGLISGYPDGTFKGQNQLTRYEVATMLARLLEDIAESRAEIMDQVDFMINDAVLAAESGLSEAEAEDVQAILQAVIDKNGVASADALSAGQAEEVANMIASLAVEFDSELMDLGIRVGSLEKKVADLENAMPEASAVTFNGEYKVELKDNAIEGDVDPEEDGKNIYTDGPFNFDPEQDADDRFIDEAADLYHQLDLNVKVENGPLTADMNLNASKQGFGFGDSENEFTLDSIEGTITGPEFVASIKKEQERGMRPYLFNGSYNDDGDWDNNKVDGVVVDAGNGTYFIDGDNDKTDGDLADDEKYAIAGTNEFDLLGGFNVVYGYEKAYKDLVDVESTTNAVFGAYKTFNIANFAVTPEFAMNKGVDEGKYFTLNAEGDLAAIKTTFNYKNIEEDFTSIEGRDKGLEKGFDVKGETSISILDVVGYYEDYEQNDSSLTYFTGEVTEDNGISLLGFNFFADGGYRSYLDEDDATSKFFNLNAKNTFGKLDVLGTLEYQNTTDLFDELDGGEDDGDYEEAADKVDKILDLDYNLSEALTAGAKYKLDKDMELTEHVYNVDYAQGIVTAGAEIKLVDEENHLYAGLNADKVELFDLFTVALAPYAEFKTWTVAEDTNIIAGVDAKKALNEYADLTAGYQYYDSEHDTTDDDHEYYGHGLWQTTKLGLEYRLTDDVKATAGYEHQDFVANDELNVVDFPEAADFEADLISAGISVAF